MPYNQSVRSFTAGEWQPTLWQRKDQEAYSSACQIMRNVIPFTQGGFSNRPGIRFKHATKNGGSSGCRLWNFVFSRTQAYGLQFENLCVRLLKNKQQHRATSIGAYSGATTYTQGQIVSYSGTNYYSKVNSNLGNTPSSSPTQWYAMTSDIIEIPLPYTAAQLSEIKLSQSADTIIITHPEHPVGKLTRTGDEVWQYNTISFGATQQPPTSLATGSAGTKVYAFTAIAASGEESVLSATISSTDTAVLTWVKPTGAIGYNIYEQVFGSWGWKGQVGDVLTCTLSAMTPAFSTTTPDWSKAPPTAVNYFGSTDNYPGASTFHEQRWLAARTNNNPQNVFGSSTGVPFSFNKSSPTQADDGFSFPIPVSSTTGMPILKHLLSFTKGVFIFSEGGEYVMGGYDGKGISALPGSTKIEPQSNWGCSDVNPMVAGKSIVFVDRSGKRVRDLLYQITFDGYDTNDLTVTANHLFETGDIKEWCFVQYPQPLIWMVTTDGRLLSLAYSIDRKQQIIAWHRHDTDGLFESICAVPNDTKTMDIYLVVKRTINGSTVRYVELMDERSFKDHTDGFFVDCGGTYTIEKTVTGITKATQAVVTAASHGLSNGDTVILYGIGGMTQVNYGRFIVSDVATNTFKIKDTVTGGYIDSTGYSTYTSGGVARKGVTSIPAAHLEGKTVVCLCDGRVVRDKVVTSGVITLDEPFGYVIYGLPYTWQVKPTKFVLDLEDGDSVNRTMQIANAFVRVYRTRSIKAAPTENMIADDQQLYGDIDNSGAMGLVSGDRKIFLQKNTDITGGTITLSSDDPCPATLLDLTVTVEYGNR